nr:tigger transposable element-derived protein 6-like [Nicotiana tomentosiformis]
MTFLGHHTQARENHVILTDAFIVAKALDFAESIGREKLKPLMTGTVAKPRCYKNVDMSSLPHINYLYNKKARMTREIFKKYMVSLIAKFEDENHKILLLLDNATPHDIEEYKIQLTHIKVHHLPPNTTSHLQPSDAGIITNFNVKYKSRDIKHFIDEYESNESHPFSSDNKFNMRQAIKTLVEAWNDVKASTCNDPAGRFESISPEFLIIAPFI